MPYNLKKYTITVCIILSSIFSSFTYGQYSISFGYNLGISETNFALNSLPNSLKIQKQFKNNDQLELHFSRNRFRHFPVIDYGDGDLISMKANTLGILFTKQLFSNHSFGFGIRGGLQYRFNSLEEIYTFNPASESRRVLLGINGIGLPIGIKFEKKIHDRLIAGTKLSFVQYFKGKEPSQLFLGLHLGYLL